MRNISGIKSVSKAPLIMSSFQMLLFFHIFILFLLSSKEHRAVYCTALACGAGVAELLKSPATAMNPPTLTTKDSEHLEPVGCTCVQDCSSIGLTCHIHIAHCLCTWFFPSFCPHNNPLRRVRLHGSDWPKFSFMTKCGFEPGSSRNITPSWLSSPEPLCS